MKGFVKSAAAAVALVVIVAGSASAQGALMSGSDHDFVNGQATYNYWNTSFQKFGICSSCHTAHHAIQTDAPLWNHTLSTATYTMYDDIHTDVSETYDAQPTGVSQACLSCHDGTVAVSALGGSTTGASTTTITGAGLISTDLSTTHPVSMTYSGGAGYEPDPEGTNGLPLYTGNKVQCGSCHDPHLNTPGPMIRPTGLDTVCLGCHIK